jgi:3-methyladenine DNA glycosylase AlkD
MRTYLRPLIDKLENTSNPERAAGARKYVKDQFEFLGTGSQERRDILKSFIDEYGPPDPGRLGEFAGYLWDMPKREYPYCAIDFLHKYVKKYRKEDIQWIEGLIIQKSWWDTVDGLASWICGSYFSQFPEMIKPVTSAWMDSGNRWLQRSALLFQLKYKGKTDTELLSEYIIRLSGHTDFFIRKAIGWILREYSKTDPSWVAEFVAGHSLSGLSYREATKYIPDTDKK